MKLRYSLIIVSLLFLCIDSLMADGSPVVLSLTAKGNYLFLRTNDGLYTLKKTGDQIQWELGEYVHILSLAPDGKLWSTKTKQDKNQAVIRCFEGEEWIEYPYPQIKEAWHVNFLYIDSKTYLITKDYDSNLLVLYVFEEQQWKRVTFFPEEIGPTLLHIYKLDDNLTISGDQNKTFHSYSFSQEEWIKTETREEWTAIWSKISASYTDIYGRGYVIKHNESGQSTTITSPENKQFDQSLGRFCGSWGMTDHEGYYYIQTHTYLNEQSDKIVSHLWNDRSGEWKVISMGDRCLDNIAFSDDSARTIWGAQGSYLAYLRDGLWIEVALLPPSSDDGDYDAGYAFLLEHYSDSKDMTQGMINDPDGYVNVRSQPGAWAPVTAVILKYVTFYHKPVGNGQWSKVLLPSGTVGYVSSDRIQPHI
jgi:Bacterial SH3 domain.